MEAKKAPRFSQQQLAEIARQVMESTFSSDPSTIVRINTPTQILRTPLDAAVPEVVTVKTKKVFSEQAKRNISAAQAKRFQSEAARKQISLARGGIRERAYPWFARGALTKDVTSITGLTADQAANARRLLRAAKRIPTPDAEQTRQSKARSHEPESVAFKSPVLIRLVRTLANKDYLAKDADEYNFLTQIYQSRQRPLNSSFMFRVILEAYSTALKNKNSYVLNLVEVAVQTANLSDLFTSEFQFLKSLDNQN